MRACMVPPTIYGWTGKLFTPKALMDKSLGHLENGAFLPGDKTARVWMLIKSLTTVSNQSSRMDAQVFKG